MLQLEVTAEQERNRKLEFDLSQKSSLAVSAREEAESLQQELQILKESQSQLEENLRKVQALLDEEQAAKTSLGAERDASSQNSRNLEAKLEEKVVCY